MPNLPFAKIALAGLIAFLLAFAMVWSFPTPADAAATEKDQSRVVICKTPFELEAHYRGVAVRKGFGYTYTNYKKIVGDLSVLMVVARGTDVGVFAEFRSDCLHKLTYSPTWWLRDSISDDDWQRLTTDPS